MPMKPLSFRACVLLCAASMKHYTSISLLFATGLASAALCASSQQMKDEGSSKELKAIIIIGRLKDFGTRNWRPSVYVDETELARSQNGRYLVAEVDPGKRMVRAEDPKHSLQMELKAGDCYFFRVEIASGFAKAHGQLVGLTREQGSSDLKLLTPIDRSHVKDTSAVLSAEEAAKVAAECSAGPTRRTLAQADGKQRAIFTPDQVNTAGWDKAWTNVANDVEQSFTPSVNKLTAIEVGLLVGNGGVKEDDLMLIVTDSGGHTLATISERIPTADCDRVLFVMPMGGIDVTAGGTYRIRLSGGTTFGWKYVVGGYEQGEATFNGKPLLPNARTTFLFRT